MSDLNGKVALVTGAGKGIGRGISLKLAEQGAFVIVNFCSSKEKAEQTVTMIQSAGGRAQICGCDVSDYDSAEKMISGIIEEHEKLDILVNNAGITKDSLLAKMTPDAFDAVVRINMKGCFNCMQLVTRQMMKQRSGRIINISSVSGVIGNFGQVNYAASKAGIIGMTKSAARELATRGITVNAVAPGFIRTEMTEELINGKAGEAIINNIPMKRYGTVEDIAGAVAFLAGDDSAFITGQVICVDGGMAM